MSSSRVRTYTAKVLYRISPEMDPFGTLNIINAVIKNLSKEVSQRFCVDFYEKVGILSGSDDAQKQRLLCSKRFGSVLILSGKFFVIEIGHYLPVNSAQAITLRKQRFIYIDFISIFMENPASNLTLVYKMIYGSK